MRLNVLIHKAFAEMAGTFMIIFVGGGSIILFERNIVPAFIVPMAWGLTVAVMIWTVSHVSGAHFNPAVTLAFAAAKRLPSTQIIVYWTSQFVGGLVAIGLLQILKKI